MRKFFEFNDCFKADCLLATDSTGILLPLTVSRNKTRGWEEIKLTKMKGSLLKSSSECLLQMSSLIQ